MSTFMDGNCNSDPPLTFTGAVSITLSFVNLSVRAPLVVFDSPENAISDSSCFAFPSDDFNSLSSTCKSSTFCLTTFPSS